MNVVLVSSGVHSCVDSSLFNMLFCTRVPTHNAVHRGRLVWA